MTRIAIVLAGAILAFLIVLIGGIAVNVAGKSLAPKSNNTSAPAAIDSTTLQTSPKQLSAEQAAQIAMNLAPGSQVRQTPELVNFQGQVAYEVLLTNGNVYVDASSGKVLFNSMTLSRPVNPQQPFFQGERHDGRDNDND